MNNFDTSSSGENISLDVFYDTDLAQIYYQDFIVGADGNQVYKIESSREVIAYLIGDSDKPYYKKYQLAKMKKAELIALWLDYDLGYYDIDIYKKSELIDELLNVSIARRYEWLWSMYNWHEFKDHFTHGYFISRGYSQGDAVYIINVGADYDVCAQQESINHILWDTPVSLRLSVNDDDEFYDLLNDEYEYDADKIIENVNKLDIDDYAKTWIAENMPSEPEYN